MGVFQSNVFQNNVFQGPHAAGVPLESDSIGSRITGGHFSKKKWRAVKSVLDYRERPKSKRRATLQIAQAQKALDKALAELEQFALAVMENYSEAKFRAFEAQQNKVAALEQRVAELEADYELEQTRIATEKERRRKDYEDSLAKVDADAKQRREQFADAKFGTADRIPQMLRESSARSQAVAAMTAKQRALREDENAALELLLNAFEWPRNI